ncbi:MAG: HAMP domain-containing histidine kinase, partial [Candidatus Omnitrophica bacterium]|nr:HAMP domain-containing histidine kinase [Candidatus Omnitrophota bacterium]
MKDQKVQILELKQALLKANDDIEKLSKVRSDFVSIISHELRTPLTSVKESISLVLDGIAGPVTEDQKRFLDMAKNNIDRLASVVIDVLDFSKLDSGRITMHKRKVNINEVIRDVHKSYKGFVEKRGLIFELNLSNKVTATWFDPKRIDQAIRNLLSNAVKFNKEKGRVKISSTKELVEGKEVIKVIVEDTGVGIPKEDMSKLFKQFSPLDTTMTRDHKGVGIGLAICKRIIGYHAGDIWIESKKNAGTKVIFILPIYKRDSEFNFLLDEAIERARYADLELSLILFKIKNPKDDTEENLSD